MLTAEENERLTRVGPGTPMGTLFRNYWQPVAPVQQLRERGVMPIRLYGQDMVLFRDKLGRVGLVDDRCAHRQVQLDCARTNELGIRCPYHGWTFDTTGQCVDQPAEPAGSTFKDRVKIGAYRVQELAGLYFAYLGPEPAPLLPHWDRLVWEDCYRVIAYAIVPCNWLQCMENTPDALHTIYLHGEFFQIWLAEQGIPKSDPRWKLAAGFQTPIIKHEYGSHKYGLHRGWLVEGQSEETANTWTSSSPLVFPNTHVTSGSGRHDFGWRIPIDDVTTMQVVLRTFQPGNGVKVPKQDVVPYYEMPVRGENGEFLSLDTINGQDFMAWTKQGPIMDRTKERLGDSDRGIIAYRQLIREQLDRVERGLDPINVFRNPAENVQIDLPTVLDRGHAWGYDKDGSYLRGSVTAADRLPEHVANEIEDLYVEAARRKNLLVEA
jgi:5,5'-dehydrodivanillate O-demethylase